MEIPSVKSPNQMNRSSDSDLSNVLEPVQGSLDLRTLVLYYFRGELLPGSLPPRGNFRLPASRRNLKS